MISPTRFVVSFAIVLLCAHGEEGRFVSGAPVSNGHPQVNVHLSQEPMDVNADTWDELQLQLTEVSQHVQLLRSRMASWSVSHAGSGNEREVAQRQ
mmetsp:Transcript_5609/g.16047  ORF Transcript_5609/g.16047 Transcript_5609/m.16047 type:complete len:96 (-) Transcript_5609:78-365(-)